MAFSLGLTLYNLGSRREVVAAVDRPPRPQGPLVWLHAPTADSCRSMMQLARRLVEDDGLNVVLTSPEGPAARPGVVPQPAPADTQAEVAAFLDHWRPEAAVFADGEVRPAAVQAAHERRIPLMMVDGRNPYLQRDREGWYPGLMRSVLGAFRYVMTVDETGARAFRKAGAPEAAIKVTGRMEEEGVVLPCIEAERDAIARQLATRPVWLAAGLPEAEEAAVIAAHRSALRLAHRLLLIVVPLDPARTGPLAARMEAEGWSVAIRSQDQEPEAENEVYLADSQAEFGMWYRLSPVTFIGGSLAGGGATRDPLEAAALGSAILCGPRTGKYGATFGRLGAARAARAVGSAADLGEALSDLLAPDRTARLAHAAWAVASDGMEATNRVVEALRVLMDGPS